MSETENTTTERLRPTFDDAYNGITGHDGRAIEKAFDGLSVDDLMLKLYDGALEAPLLVVLVQMLEFVRERHDGVDDAKALKKILDLPRKEVMDLTASYMADDEEPFADEPVTEVGKDDSATD